MKPHQSKAPRREDDVISYFSTPEAWSRFKGVVAGIIQESDVQSVIEIGGGAQPLFSLEEISDLGVDYTLLDISQEELDRAPAGYLKVQADIADPNANLPHDKYDLAFSQMVAEHVKDGEQMHRNVFHLLKPGGRAFHFFPTFYTLPFLVNRAIPNRQSSWLLEKITPDEDGEVAKFPAYYDWCFGPTKKQFERLTAIGFEIEKYDGFFGHIYYRKLPPLQKLIDYKSRMLLRRPVPSLTTFSQVLVRKPEDKQ